MQWVERWFVGGWFGHNASMIADPKELRDRWRARTRYPDISQRYALKVV